MITNSVILFEITKNLSVEDLVKIGLVNKNVILYQIVIDYGCLATNNKSIYIMYCNIKQFTLENDIIEIFNLRTMKLNNLQIKEIPNTINSLINIEKLTFNHSGIEIITTK